MRRILVLLAAVLLLPACAAAGPAPAPAAAPAASASGHLFIVGGGPRPDHMMARFIELAGGPGAARILVVPTASANAEGAGERLREEMLRRGASDARIAHLTREEAMRVDVDSLLADVTGVWFGGGSQNRITAALEGTPVAEALHRLHGRGGVIGGTSAGAAIMSEIMITGGEHRRGGDRPSDEAHITIDRDNIRNAPGLGFLDNAIVDQHFVRRKRNNRLISLVLENPSLVGMGIDEATAVVVDPTGRWTVVGESVVLVYDAREAAVTAPGDPVLGAAGLRMHILPPGAVFDPRTGRTSVPD